MKKTSMTDMELSNISAGKGRAFIPPDAEEKDMACQKPKMISSPNQTRDVRIVVF